jgi:hypothetical protein
MSKDCASYIYIYALSGIFGFAFTHLQNNFTIFKAKTINFMDATKLLVAKDSEREALALI